MCNYTLHVRWMLATLSCTSSTLFLVVVPPELVDFMLSIFSGSMKYAISQKASGTDSEGRIKERERKWISSQTWSECAALSCDWAWSGKARDLSQVTDDAMSYSFHADDRLSARILFYCTLDSLFGVVSGLIRLPLHKGTVYWSLTRKIWNYWQWFRPSDKDNRIADILELICQHTLTAPLGIGALVMKSFTDAYSTAIFLSRVGTELARCFERVWEIVLTVRRIMSRLLLGKCDGIWRYQDTTLISDILWLVIILNLIRSSVHIAWCFVILLVADYCTMPLTVARLQKRFKDFIGEILQERPSLFYLSISKNNQ